MALTTRLLVFFLSLLALVLICFSSSLYFFASNYLSQRVDERLKLVMSTVTSGIEFSSEGLEWEPGNRHLQFERPIVDSQFGWVVTDKAGKIIERSAGFQAESFLRQVELAATDHSPSNQIVWNEESWRIARQTIEARFDDVGQDKREYRPDETDRFSELVVTAGISLSPTKTLLRQLGLTLIGLSFVVWLIGLASGRWICRSALLPISRMAKVANEIDANQLAKRLPELFTGDELADLSRAFNQLLDRLQEAFERQRRFTGEASHQLRTPLTVLLGQIEVTLVRDRATEEYKRVLTILQQNSQHLSNVVDSLLFLARADSEAASPSFEKIDLAEWLPEHVETWLTHPRYTDMSLTGADLRNSVIDVHPVLLGELVNILLDNACKYSNPQTPITIALNRDDTTASISIIDSGCGIDEAEFADLFTPFRRSEQARLGGIPGTGLGLSIAKRLATVLRCDLTVTSKPHQGSQFQLRFQRSQ